MLKIAKAIQEKHHQSSVYDRNVDTSKDIDTTSLSTEVAAVADWNGTCFDGVPWALFNDDAKVALEKMPDASVDCVVTSPPYFWLRDYGVRGQIGLEDSIEEYIASIQGVMAETMRVLRKEGVLFLNIGDTYYSGKGMSHGKDKKNPKRRFGLRAVDKSGGMGIGLQRKSIIGIPWRTALKMTSSGWILRSPIIWHREQRLPEYVTDRPSRSYEYVFMFAKSRKYYFHKQPLIDQKVEEDMWTIPAKPKYTGLDTAPYPDDLVRRCLEIGCPAGGVVMDPFVGSGTTMRVALKMHHPVIGIELNREFCTHIIHIINTL